MHNNYYFLKQLSNQLKNELVGYKISEIYSQTKNELVICLYNENEEKFILVHLDPSFCCLSFPQKLNRARRNSVNLFPSIIGQQISDVVQVEQDRSFYFELGNNFQLLFKMHGNRANIILFHERKIIEVFNKKLKQDYSIMLNDLSKSLITNEDSFNSVEGNISKLMPTFGKTFDLYFEKINYDQLNLKTKYQCFVSLLNYLQNPEFFIHINSDGIPVLKLYKIDDNDLRFIQPSEALNIFYKKYISTVGLEKGKAEIKKTLTAKIRKSESYITKSSSRLKVLVSKTNYQNIGDLIMANLHNIKPYSTEIHLEDFYSREPILIQLKSLLTPQMNAENYYRKAKNQQIEIDTIKKNISLRGKQVEELKKQIEELSQISSLKQIGKKTTKKPSKKELPFHKVNFMAYEILIGKNANKNELLTFGYARKNDLFLHAKDVAGSHVIIKKKTNQNIPKKVIEKAAAFAAYYSKNKTASLSRVLYTPKKYVRKVKGAPPGAVIIEKESVVLVLPQKINYN